MASLFPILYQTDQGWATFIAQGQGSLVLHHVKLYFCPRNYSTKCIFYIAHSNSYIAFVNLSRLRVRAKMSRDALKTPPRTPHKERIGRIERVGRRKIEMEMDWPGDSLYTIWSCQTSTYLLLTED